MSWADNHAGVVLMVEDNREFAARAAELLGQVGYTVDYAPDGEVGLQLASNNRYDVILLDARLPRPHQDGFRLCQQLRDRVHGRRRTPVMMITGLGALDDRLAGFAAGADDYLVKPFDGRELIARLQALIRRDRCELVPKVMTVGDLSLDTGTRRVSRAGRLINLRPVPQRILEILMRESPHVVYREDLEREIWGDEPPDSDTLRSHLYQLRIAIDRPFDRPLLHTVTRTGYALRVTRSSADE